MTRRDVNPMVNAALLSASICIAGLAMYLATIRRVGPVDPLVAELAAGIALFGTVPPLWFSHWITHVAVRQMAVVVWRCGMLVPIAFLLSRLEGSERNCFLYVVLACYFVALPLESWLLIRESKRAGQ